MFEWEKDIVPGKFYKGNRRRIYWVITRGGAASILILMFHSMIFLIGESFPQTPVDPQSHLLATSIFASATLSFVLIAVYRDIGETQSEQKDILKNQNSLMEASNEPSIDVTGIEINGSNQIEVMIENAGNGPASSLSATIHFRPVEPDSQPYNMPKFRNQENIFRPLTRDDSTGSTSIRAGKNDTYVAEIALPDFGSQGLWLPADQAVRNLRNSGIDEIDLQPVIRFDHLLPTKGKGYVYLKMRRCDISGGNVNSESDLWSLSSKWVGMHPSQLDEQNLPFRDPGTYYES